MHQREGRRKVQKDLLFGAAAALSAAPRVCFPPRLALKLKGQQVWWDSTWLSLKAPWSARRFRSRSGIERSFIFHKMALRSLAGRLLNILIMRAQRPSSLNGYTLSDHLQENTLLVESWILKERISYRKSADELHSRLTELLSFFPSLQTLGRLGRISVRTLAHRYFHVLSRVGSVRRALIETAATAGEALAGVSLLITSCVRSTLVAQSCCSEPHHQPAALWVVRLLEFSHERVLEIACYGYEESRVEIRQTRQHFFLNG